MIERTSIRQDARRSSAPLPAPRFVGRDREMAALAEILDRGPTLVLVEGEAGIGKSRLLQELWSGPTGRRYRRLTARCPPFREPYTLGPLVDAVRQATDRVADLGLSDLAGALRPLFPEWAADLPPVPEMLVDTTASRHRLFRALAELLDRLGVAVLVVEDVHWADDATLEFLLFLTSSHAPPISLLTYRPQEVPAGSLLLRLSSRVLPGGAPTRLTLEPLDVVGIGDLVSSMLDGERVSAGFATFLHQRTDGLPLAAEESVRLMHGRADLIRRDGEWVRRRIIEIDVPPTVRDAVLERSQRLDAHARVVLEAAAVLAEPTGEATLAAVCTLPVDTLRTGLTGALGSGLVREDERGLLSFRHALAARAVYDAIPAPRRRTLHLCAGQVLESACPPPVARLARHFREAGEVDAWARYAEQAADHALASSDETSAGALLHDLLTNADLSAATVVRLVRKIPLLSSTGPAWYGDLVALLRSLLDRTRMSPGEEAELRLLLGRVLLTMEEYGRARAEMERAVGQLTAGSVDAIATMNYLGWPRGPAPAAVHRKWLRRAGTALADAAGQVSSGARMTLRVDRTSALLMMGEEAGWTEAAGIREDAVSQRDLWRVAVGHFNVSTGALRWGRYPEAARRLDRALDLAERHQLRRVRNLVRVARAHLRWFTGDWDGLLDLATALADNDSMQPVSRNESVLVAGLLHAALGSPDAATENLQRVLADALRYGATEDVMEPAAALAGLRLADGAADEALRVTDEPAEIIAGKGIWLWATDLAPARVRALLATGRDEPAAELVAGFGRGLRGRHAPAPRAALLECRALLAEHRGDLRRAAPMFARAQAAWQALPRPHNALRCGERRAHCLLASGDTSTGLDTLTEVLSGLSTLGARVAVDRVVRALREHGVDARQPGRRGRPSYGNRLSPRELDVIRLMVDGQTNRQIAEALTVSTQTVTSHLHSAMRKLRVRSRTALAVTVVELGLIADRHPVERGK